MPSPILYDTSTGTVLVVSPEPGAPVPAGAALLEIADAERAKFGVSYANFTVDPATGVVTATVNAAAQQAAQQELAGATERSAASTDLQASYQAAVTRLDAIIAAGTFATAAARDAAIV